MYTLTFMLSCRWIIWKWI